MTDIKRRRFMVQGFQHRFLALNLIYFVLLLTAAAIAFFAPLILPASEGNEVARDLLLLNSRVWPALVLLAIFFVCHSILASHKVAGAIYRFCKVFEKVGAGDLTARARLRRKDYLHPEAAELNTMIASVHARVCAVVGSHDALQTELRRLNEAVKVGSRKGVEEVIARLHAESEQLGAHLEEFNTGPRTVVIDESSLEHLPPIRRSQRDDVHVVVAD